MNGQPVPNRAGDSRRIIQDTSWFEVPDKMPGEGTRGSKVTSIPASALKPNKPAKKNYTVGRITAEQLGVKYRVIKGGK